MDATKAPNKTDREFWSPSFLQLLRITAIVSFIGSALVPLFASFWMAIVQEIWHAMD